MPPYQHNDSHDKDKKVSPSWDSQDHTIGEFMIHVCRNLSMVSVSQLIQLFLVVRPCLFNIQKLCIVYLLHNCIDMQGLFWESARSVRDDVAMKRRLSLAEYIHGYVIHLSLFAPCTAIKWFFVSTCQCWNIYSQMGGRKDPLIPFPSYSSTENQYVRQESHLKVDQYAEEKYEYRDSVTVV